MSEGLVVDNLSVHFRLGGKSRGNTRPVVRAVDGISFSVDRGEILGLVGESGSGKTTVGRSILRLVPATAGTILWNGESILELPANRLGGLRRRMQMVFQDPISSLNPRMNVGNTIAYPMYVHKLHQGKLRDQRVEALLEMVGLSAAAARYYPHELSAGDRQRVGIARALAVEPEFLFLDEPVASLDVSMQAQILNLLRDIRNELGITMLFVSHNLAVVEYLCDRVAVMYVGKLCEIAAARSLYENPSHPYTLALMSAISRIDSASNEDEIVLEGEIPSPLAPPSGCRFHTRCFARLSTGVCESIEPELRMVKEGHMAACHLIGDAADRGLPSTEERRTVVKPRLAS
jgi:oligopeptide transport system ATP-binding protein